MAAIDMSLAARSEAVFAQLAKRKNFAQREPGVIVVFAIVGAVAILVIGMLIQKRVRLSQVYGYGYGYTKLTPPRWLPARLASFKDTPSELVEGRDNQERVGSCVHDCYG